MVFLDGIFLVSIVLLLKEVKSTEFEYIEKNVQEHDASADCVSRGGYLAIIDSQEKFVQVYNLLTNNGRVMPSAAVYIGLKYNTATKKHVWVDGTALTWADWYTNEPYNVDTRHCVRLDLDSNLRFRTTDCTYQHHYICSTKGGEVTSVPANSKKGTSDVMIVGLSVGFGVSAAVIAICCLMCYCCCSSRDQPKRPLIQYKGPPKPRAVVGSLRVNKPPQQSVYYSKYSSSRNSNNTSRSGSSRLEDMYDDAYSVIINPSDRRTSVHSGGHSDYQYERSSASPRDPNEILHYI
uniref:Uncharacterized protein LOC111134896 n=1 Tax=Crassostrea virginica TaxID=6565 RepID=A0A8B8EHM1_CRAVI|nr:uncharacterized protein LOC111134896 [Crassostrea virginica]